MDIYKALRKHFGFRHWWPGDSPFEVFVGAVLTQQTTWLNVEKAISNLKHANALDINKIAYMKIADLRRLIRPSGYYRQKATRLKQLCRTIIKQYGSFNNMLMLDKNQLRKALLAYNGIGRETADSIILYAAEKPIFVIDAYTKRAMSRINPSIRDDVDYDELRTYFEGSIKRNVRLYKDFHAQFVELGKNYCRKSFPLCSVCPLQNICSFGKAH